MNILFVVDEFPFPPRNGVTLPIANFIELFSMNGFRVDILLLGISDSGEVEGAKLENFVTALAWLPLKRTGRAIGLFSELLGRRALFEAWLPRDGFLGDKLLGHYDVVWASPIRSYGLWLKFGSSVNISASKLVAAINDSYSLTLKELSKRKSSWFEGLIYRCRAFAMYRIEKKLLKKADIVAVQSRREVDFFKEMFGEGGGADFIELKNGVSTNLFQDRPVAVCDLLFVGSLDAFYRPTLDWFIREVYSEMPSPRPSFLVVGKGAADEDIRRFSEFSIDYLPFVDDIKNSYLTSKILIAPIFKGYGTINKVLEAMAAGCVVVGDRTAFNGIENFVAGRDGLVAESPGEFLECIQAVLADPHWASTIGESARNLMRKDFSWDSRLHAVCDRLNIS